MVPPARNRQRGLPTSWRTPLGLGFRAPDRVTVPTVAQRASGSLADADYHKSSAFGLRCWSPGQPKFKGQGPGLVNVLFVKRKFDYSHGTPHPDGDAHTHCGRRDTTHYATGRR